MQRIKRDDQVMVITGKERGKRGQVREVFSDDDRAIVQGLNMVKRHQRQRDERNPAGIIEKEGPIHVSNLKLFCLACDSDDIEWTKSAGTGTVYSATTVRMKVAPDLVPPYVVAIVELDEGPRMLTNVVGGDCPIGQRVRVTWKERTDAPPLPLFEPISG